MDIDQLVVNIQTLLREGACGQGQVSAMLAGVKEMEANAARVGLIPAKYPLHVTLIIKIIHALLPWYARTIRAFCLTATAVARQQADALCAVVQQQEQILRRLQAIERELRAQRGAGQT
jgi:hypothetical protein